MLKVIASIIMLIDHIAFMFFPDVYIIRALTRGMPLFAYMTARGVHYTLQNGTFDHYFKKMVIFAVISQAPYMLMVERLSGSIGLLWIISLLFLKHYDTDQKKVIDYVIICGCILTTIIIPMDYGLYGLITVFIFYRYLKQTNKPKKYSELILSFITLHIILLLINSASGTFHLFSLLSLPIIKLCDGHNKPKINSLIFYAFYPVHITILLIIKYTLGL